MITVEGNDNCGKTTLVHQLCKDFPQLKYHPSIGNKHDLGVIVEQAYYQVYEADVNEIWDRSRLISEYIYNPVLNRRQLAFNPSIYFKYLNHWLQNPQLLIWCNRPIEKIRETFDERDQLGGVFEHLEELQHGYETFMAFIAWFFNIHQVDRPKYLIEYDFEKDSYEGVRDIVARYLVEAEQLIDPRGLGH